MKGEEKKESFRYLKARWLEFCLNEKWKCVKRGVIVIE